MLDKQPILGISAGHGLASRNPGKVDPGANIVTSPHDEDDLTLTISKWLYADFSVLFRGTHGRVFLRNAGPYYKADDEAHKQGCDLFIENHLNAGGGTGTEVIYESKHSADLARDLSLLISDRLDIRNRGGKQRDDLAVLTPHPGMRSVLIEWFFADSKVDIAKWRDNHRAAELAVVNRILIHYGWRKVKSLPREWNKAKRAMYRPY